MSRKETLVQQTGLYLKINVANIAENYSSDWSCWLQHYRATQWCAGTNATLNICFLFLSFSALRKNNVWGKQVEAERNITFSTSNMSLTRASPRSFQFGLDDLQMWDTTYPKSSATHLHRSLTQLCVVVLQSWQTTSTGPWSCMQWCVNAPSR